MLSEAPLLTIDSPAFTIAISCIAIFVTVYFNNRRIKMEMEKNIDTKIDKKASIPYVDQQDKSLHHRIDEVGRENETLEKKIDENQMFIITRLETLNTNILNLHKDKK